MATPIKLKRSLVAGASPTALLTGELAVNIPDKKIWIGDGAGAASLLFNAGAYLPLAGGTMTGTIVAPSGVNFMSVIATNFAIMGGGGGIAVRNGGTNLMLFGPTLTTSANPISLPSDPTANLHAATKQYVDAKLSTALLPTPTPTRLGGVFSGEATPGNVMYGIDTAGAPIFKQIAVPYPTATTLGGVKSAGPNANQYVSGVDTFGVLTFADLPAASTPYVLPPAKSSALGGIYANVPVINTENEFVRGVDESGQLVFGNVVFPPASTPYVLPTASATVLGGVKIGANLTIDASGVLSASGGTTYTLPIASATVLGGIKIGAGLSIDAAGVVSASATGSYLPLAGGTMTGSIYLPTTVSSFSWGAGSYNIFGSPSGGVALRNNATNLVLFTGANVTYSVPMVTAGSGIGIQFGSGGATLSRGSAASKIAANGAIELPADPTAPLEAATKQYVDSKSGGTSVTNPVAGSAAGLTLWVGTQAQYDAIATKDSKTVYNITA